MEQYTVTGMSCASCSARVEKAVMSVEGVTACSVNLLTNSMGVEGNATAESIITAVEKAGYGAKPKFENKQSKLQADDEILKDTETPKLRKRLIFSLVFLIPLMYISMGHMWGWHLPEFFDENHIAIGLTQLLLCVVVMIINQKFFISGVKSALHRSPNMDTLVALGSGAAFLYSVYSLFAMTVAQDKMIYMNELYFESSAMILTLITVGKMLEAYSKGKTTNALKSLIKLNPKTANVLVNGIEKEISIENLKINDVFVVRPGENIPADGVIIEGTSAINEATLTGESIPVDKNVGDVVSTGTVNQFGFIKCKATAVGENTTLSQIIKMVSDASSTKAPIAKVADKVSGIFVPTVIIIAIITFIVWLLVGESFGFSLARGISVLVISCPCALGLATPVAIMVSNGIGAKNGILFKNATAIEMTGKMNIVALDKTGTITSGEPKVTDIIANENFTENQLLKIAYSLEKKSEHPLAKAIVLKAEENNLDFYDVKDFKALSGNGLTAIVNDKKAFGGNFKFISQNTKISKDIKINAENLANEGKTPLFFSYNGEFCGLIAVADVIKSESYKAISNLKDMGIKVVMLTGDNEKTAKAICKEIELDEVFAGLLPNEKENIIKELKKSGKVLMVGDGINDAPALASADIGVAIGSGTDVAIDVADIVLVKSRLTDVVGAIRLSKATLKNIYENLFWAFIYNIIGIPLAAGLFINIFGWQLNPMFGAAAMSLSSFCVVTNALRLNLKDVFNSKKDKFKDKKTENFENLDNKNLDNKNSNNKLDYKKEYKNERENKNNIITNMSIKNDIFENNITKNNTDEFEKEKKIMKKVIKIDGMMCPHCENTVKTALEGVEGVNSAIASHKEGTAVVELNKEVSEDILKNIVENKGYSVISIE